MNTRLVVLCRSLIVMCTLALCGCYTYLPSRSYQGPPERPEEIESYYHYTKQLPEFSITPLRQTIRYRVQRINLDTEAGEVVIDYYQRFEPSDELIMVLPILGGRKNMIASYFAEYFARHGYDTAIVHRDKDFKKPENFERLEEILKDNVIRDRIALDFFEDIYGKRRFGSFGISRGAINAAITAGVDPRLEYNVLALGGTKLDELFFYSDERKIRRYKEKVKKLYGLTDEEFLTQLRTLRTDPEELAHYIDADDTLMVLSAFDSTVPIQYGDQLRKQIGRPRTIYLLADHRTALLYTQFVPLVPPNRCFGFFPFDFIEGEALTFFDERFERPGISVQHLFFEGLQLPFYVYQWLFG